MAEMLVNETNVLKFLQEKVEPQQLGQIVAHFDNQTTDAIKRVAVVEQVLEVLKTSTQSGVIQEANKFYYANTHVDDVRRIMMDEDDWFRATPSEIALEGAESSSALPSPSTQDKL